MSRHLHQRGAAGSRRCTPAPSVQGLRGMTRGGRDTPTSQLGRGRRERVSPRSNRQTSLHGSRHEPSQRTRGVRTRGSGSQQTGHQQLETHARHGVVAPCPAGVRRPGSLAITNREIEVLVRSVPIWLDAAAEANVPRRLYSSCPRLIAWALTSRGRSGIRPDRVRFVVACRGACWPRKKHATKNCRTAARTRGLTQASELPPDARWGGGS